MLAIERGVSFSELEQHEEEARQRVSMRERDSFQMVPMTPKSGARRSSIQEVIEQIKVDREIAIQQHEELAAGRNRIDGVE